MLYTIGVKHDLIRKPSTPSIFLTEPKWIEHNRRRAKNIPELDGVQCDSTRFGTSVFVRKVTVYLSSLYVVHHRWYFDQTSENDHPTTGMFPVLQNRIHKTQVNDIVHSVPDSINAYVFELHVLLLDCETIIRVVQISFLKS